MRTVLLLVLAALPAAAQGLEVVGRYDSGLKQGTEIISIQATTKRAVLTLGARGVQLLDLADPAKPKLLRALPWGGAEGSQVTSAAFHPTRDLVAVAYRLQDRKERGGFALIRPGQGLLTYMTRAGYDPDHIAFDPTGRYLVIATRRNTTGSRGTRWFRSPAA